MPKCDKFDRPDCEAPVEENSRNPRLPNKAAIVSETTLVSRKGNKYRIIRTSEKDPYDPPDDKK